MILKLSKSLIFKDISKSAGVRKSFKKKSTPSNVAKEMHARGELSRQRLKVHSHSGVLGTSAPTVSSFILLDVSRSSQPTCSLIQAKPHAGSNCRTTKRQLYAIQFSGPCFSMVRRKIISFFSLKASTVLLIFHHSTNYLSSFNKARFLLVSM